VARGGQLDLRRLLTLGGRAPAAVGAVLWLSLLATVAGSFSPTVGEMLVLIAPAPGATSWMVLLEAWRLVTWVLYQGPLPGSLLTLLFAGLMLVWLGQQLSYAWSERSFLVRCLWLTAGSAAGTLLLLLPLGVPGAFFDLWALVNALLVTWGLIFPNQRLAWFGVLQMSGATVAKVVTIATPAWALVMVAPQLGVVTALLRYLPHMLAIALAWILVAGGPRRMLSRLERWWYERRLARARRKFKVIDTRKPPSSYLN